jgi:hypothetical protein
MNKNKEERSTFLFILLTSMAVRGLSGRVPKEILDRCMPHSFLDFGMYH